MTTITVRPKPLFSLQAHGISVCRAINRRFGRRARPRCCSDGSSQPAGLEEQCKSPSQRGAVKVTLGKLLKAADIVEFQVSSL